MLAPTVRARCMTPAVTSRVDLDAMFAVLKDTLGREQL